MPRDDITCRLQDFETQETSNGQNIIEEEWLVNLVTNRDEESPRECKW